MMVRLCAPGAIRLRPHFVVEKYVVRRALAGTRTGAARGAGSPAAAVASRRRLPGTRGASRLCE